MSKISISRNKYRIKTTVTSRSHPCHNPNGTPKPQHQNDAFDRKQFPPRSTHRGKVTEITDFGAFVELQPGIVGLVHISELSWEWVDSVSKVVRIGEQVDVMVLSIDIFSRKISLSMKQLIQPEQSTETVPKVPLKGGLSSNGSDGEKFGLKF